MYGFDGRAVPRLALSPLSSRKLGMTKSGTRLPGDSRDSWSRSRRVTDWTNEVMLWAPTILRVRSGRPVNTPATAALALSGPYFWLAQPRHLTRLGPSQVRPVVEHRPGRAGVAVVADRDQERDVRTEQRRGARVGDPAVGVDQVRLELPNQAAQLERHDRIGEGRVIAPAGIAREAGRPGRQGRQAMEGDAFVVLLPGQALVPHRGHGHLVAPPMKLLAQDLHLALGPADERPVEVAGHQDPAAHQLGPG